MECLPSASTAITKNSHAQSLNTKWGSPNKESILNIIPKEVGYTKITICTVEGSGFDEKFNTNSGITVGVTVLEDNSGIVYNGNGISYKSV